MSEVRRRNINNKRRGTKTERDVARLVGGQRVANMGGRFFDVQTPSAGYEVKSRQQRTPRLIAGAWEQAQRAAQETGLEPNVVLAFVDGGKRRFWQVKELEA